MLNDPLANALSLMLNNELVGKSECLIKPVSKVIKDVMKILKQNNYIGNFKEIEETSGNYIKLNLIGSINKCNVIKPRYSVKNNNFEKFERRYLPAKNVGILIVSTPMGIMTHNDVKSKNIGGRLLAYCY